MPIEDVFSISGRGTVVTGRVERGVINVGDEIEIVGIKDTQKTTYLALKCSANCLTAVKQATTLARFCVVWTMKRWNVAKFSVSQAL